MDSISDISRTATVSDLMTKDIVHLTKDSRISEVMRHMVKADVGSVVICEGPKPIGIITEKDILARVVLKELDPAEARADDIMTKDIITISEHSNIDSAARLMRKKRIKRLIVIEGGDVRGIITQTDIFRGMNNVYGSYRSLLWNPKLFLMLALLVLALYLLNLIFR